MISKLKNLCVLIALIIIASGCGDSKKEVGTKDLSSFFPERLDGTDLAISSELRTFKGQSLYEYINGGAEIYHQYGFVEVATASYKTGEKEIILDIYRFGRDDDAYGLYSSIKPPGPGDVQLGIEGFSTANSIDFVKGSHLVRIVGFDESDTTRNAIEKLAEYLGAAVPGTEDKPATFDLFPRDYLIPGSEMMQAESFVGQIFLNDVYTVDYDIEGDEITLFVSEDSTGEKYVKWFEAVEPEDFDQSGLSYDLQNCFLYNNDYYGAIVAGLIKGKMAGLIGYKESHREFLSRWLESLKTPE